MASQRGSDIDVWLERLDDDSRSQAEYLVNVVGGGDTRFEQAVKWDRITFTVGGNWHHWICGIAATKKGVALVFHKGALLDDPDGLLTGSGRYVREVPAEQVRRHSDAIGALLGSAINHQTDMLP